MESSHTGSVLDPKNCNGLPLEEKRQLVREVAQWSDDAYGILKSFSRKELLEIIRAELGKERKYNGYTKSRMIECLLKLLSANSKRKSSDDALDLSLVESGTGEKKQKKNGASLQLPTFQDHVPRISRIKSVVKSVVCGNLACKAALSSDDGFCKRCSCCVCYRYDENKDPSLWLTCEPDLSNGDYSCGLSCHLKCALKNERAGISKSSKCGKLDGSFYCVSCSKVNDLMSTWRKQVLAAKEARRVDVLCLRISMCHNILDGTDRYKDLHKHIDAVAKTLKKELGELDQVGERMDRCLVNRLSCGAEVQKLCASALEAFEAIFSKPYTYFMTPIMSPSCKIHFVELYPTSVVIVLEYDEEHFEEFLGCRIWHRKSSLKEYGEKPTCIALMPAKKFKIGKLKPCTEYICKVSIFSCARVYGTWEAKWATPPSIGVCASDIIDETPRQAFRSLNEINATQNVSRESIPSTSSNVDARHAFPCLNNVSLREWTNSSFEHCVTVIKNLEREGHMKVEFRVKFLTWFSLKATAQDRRIVSAFVDTMEDDLPILAEQLIDAFADEIWRCSSRILP